MICPRPWTELPATAIRSTFIGDLNVRLHLSDDANSRQLRKLLEVHCFAVRNTEPTHVRGGTLCRRDTMLINAATRHLVRRWSVRPSSASVVCAHDQTFSTHRVSRASTVASA